MQTRHVIIADMETETRHLLAQEIANRPGMAVAGVTENGGTLLTLCDRTQCDIVVMDLVLANMDGLEVLERIGRMPEKPTVIVLSRFVSSHVAEICAARGADYLIMKPCSAETVANCVCRMARHARGGADAAAGELKLTVTSLIHEIGIPSHIKGYQYLRDAILLAVEDMSVTECITKVLYPHIAKRYTATACAVERAIRHAIEIGWSRGDQETLRRYFGGRSRQIQEKPTNSEFISAIADRLRLQYGTERI